MDTLIENALEGLDSQDPRRISKSLRQLNMIIGQIVLTSDGHRSLSELSEDPAYRGFLATQDKFDLNIPSRLIVLLERLLSRGGEDHDLVIVNALDLLHGILLMHSASKSLFLRAPAMDLLLDLLEPCNCPAIQKAALFTLTTALIDAPRNFRVFEKQEGLLAVVSLFKARSTSRDLRMKLMEFLYFYLMPETASIPRAEQRDSVPGILQRSPSKLAKAFGGADADSARRGRSDSTSAAVLTTEEKQALLSRYLSNVDDLVRDLRDCTPFGVVC